MEKANQIIAFWLFFDYNKNIFQLATMGRWSVYILTVFFFFQLTVSVVSPSSTLHVFHVEPDLSDVHLALELLSV